MGWIHTILKHIKVKMAIQIKSLNKKSIACAPVIFPTYVIDQKDIKFHVKVPFNIIVRQHVQFGFPKNICSLF